MEKLFFETRHFFFQKKINPIQMWRCSTLLCEVAYFLNSFKRLYYDYLRSSMV